MSQHPQDGESFRNNDDYNNIGCFHGEEVGPTDMTDDHEHDMVMPGFRFHPTEEELVEFYLRRKVEGKRFNVELITFLDLYRYDPWELPGGDFTLPGLQKGGSGRPPIPAAHSAGEGGGPFQKNKSW
ncbi:hypothetical protein DM860_007518 [Cuscuta australis]|uniref:NAC domain-containing protein n=1 Tax=Cuscuta australis TaxID=267555 RepID=A0A328E5F4_9ASTE|nr:hypothetical protein DM860_007518 [Cuscuta australis]